MDKVLNITDRLEKKKKREQIETSRHVIEALRRIVRCSSCPLKCAMCGCQLEAPCACNPDSSSHSDFSLCASCRTEFNDFLDVVSGKRGAEVFWHSREWLRLWSAWVDYREAIKEFRDSPEFKQLNTEFES